MKPLVGLIDCNNFFVSCERLFRPDLANRPVLVLSSNDGCVVARSQEVKDIGIPMGVPYFKIKDIIKDNEIAVFSGNLTLYRDISRRVFNVVKESFDTVEQYSIDESFILLPDSKSVLARIQTLRDRIWHEVGIPVSIGVASSKTLAKVAVDEAKRRDGWFVLTDSEWQTMCEERALHTIWGVGRALAEQYRSSGLITAHDLIVADPNRVAQKFGVYGRRQQSELQGEYVFQVENKRSLQKSLMSSRSFSQTTSDQGILADAVSYHTRHLAAELRSMQALTACIRVSVRTSRHGDYFLRGGSEQAQLPQPTNDTFQLLEQAQRLLTEVYEPGVPYQKVGVVLHDISAAAGATEPLFPTDTKTPDRLLAVIDQLNQKQDQEVVLFGSRLKTANWQAKSAARSGAYTTRWSDVPTVSAG